MWNPYTDKNIDATEIVQWTDAKWASNKNVSYGSVTEILSNFGWHSVLRVSLLWLVTF